MPTSVMLIVWLVFLGLPASALVMGLGESLHRTGLDSSVRRQGKWLASAAAIVMLMGGGIIILTAGGLQISLLRDWLADNTSNWETLLRSGLASLLGAFGLLLIYTAYFCGRVIRRGEARESSPLRTSQQLADSQRLKILLWMIGLAPFAPQFLLPAVVVFFFMMNGPMGWLELRRRGRQTEVVAALAMAVRHEASLPTEIDALAATADERYSKRLRRLSESVSDGVPLWQALAQSPAVLPMEDTAAIHAAEQQGLLKEALPELATQYGLQLETIRDREYSRLSFRYLGTVVCIGFLVVSFVMYYIVPKFKQIFLDFGIVLPAETEWLIDVSDEVVNHWYLMIPLFSLLACLAACLGWICSGRRRTAWNIPDGIWPRFTTPTVLKALAGGAEMRETLTSTLQGLADTTSAAMVAARFQSLQSLVSAGEGLGEALRQERFLTRRESEALLQAEQLGHLPWALRAIARKIEDGRGYWIELFLRLMEPLAILFMGLCVALLCIAFFVPVVKLIIELS
ncbi:type II secretion system F family protein [Planctomicrobium sp. SH664]|uniref:type II secretion system F family protein n=1 Tax=Planctomicrobium sp. SH664 TaxID=3448125 RepID=UPI003F5B6A36